MTKKRVHEAAKELRISARDMLALLHRAGVEAKSNFSVVDDADISKVKRLITDELARQKETGEKKERVKAVASAPARPVGKAAPEAAEETKEDEEAPAGAAGEALEDIYTSPAKRLEAIRRREMERQRRGTKTTFVRKKSGKKGYADRGARGGVKAEEPPQREPARPLRFSGSLTIKEVSRETGIKSADIIMYLIRELGLMATINQSLDEDVITLLAERFGFQVEVRKEEEPQAEEVEDRAEDLEQRPPVVTIMGHVDHGKTKLLDTIRHTNVTATESGGITQHIGAYQIDHVGRKITFLDTPGHESFTAMRARGAKVTDLAVLVVAADDGVMPQTLEAIDHARAAGVPILVAVNKIDKPQSNPEKARRQLAEHALVPEEWGGDTIFVDISAKFGTNINNLLDMVFLATDIQELKANPKRKSTGSIVEAQLDKGKGPVATVLVQNGTLYTGDVVVVGLTCGKIRAMENDLGERVPMAGPSAPVKIYGLDAVPQAGDRLFVVEDEKKAREIVQRRQLKDREEKMRYAGRVTLQEIFQKIRDGKVKELKVVLKADVQGSVEAIRQSLEGIKHEEVRVNVIRAAVGEIKETDVMLASASNAVILGFNVHTNPTAAAMAAEEKVEVRNYEVIYKLTEDVKQALVGMLAPEYVEQHAGTAEVLKTFVSARAGTIAGCMVAEGEVSVGDTARVYRDGRLIHEGKIKTLKRFKDSVRSVKSGFECGMTIEGTGDFEEKDQIKVFSVVEKRRESLE
ncbi:MAG: translation initiation factor IF-2 [bacterium]